MTLSAANIATGGSGVAATSYVTVSVSLTGGRMYWLAVRSLAGAGTVNVPTVTGAGQTWTQQATRLDSGNALRRTTVFTARPGVSNSGALTIDFGGQSQTGGFGWLLDEITSSLGIVAGESMMLQTAGTDSANASVTSATATLAAFRRTSNGAYAVITCPGAAASVTPESGYTGLANAAAGFGMGASEFKATSDTTPSFTLDTRVVTGLIAFEINDLQAVAPAGGATPSGVLGRRATFHLGGAATPTGGLAQRATFHLAGALTSAGALVPHGIHRLLLAGTLTSSGALTRARITVQALVGALTSLGDLVLGLIRGKPPLGLADVLKGDHQPVVELQFLSDDLQTVLATVAGDLISGSVSMDRSRDVHRQASCSLVNDSGLYTPTDSSSLVWPSRVVRLRRGALVSSVATFVDLITGVLSTPKETAHSAVVPFTVLSRLQIANRPFSAPLSFAAGTALAVAVRAIAQAGALGTLDSLYDLQDGGATLAAVRSYDSSANMLTSMVKLAFDCGCDLYDTGAGVLMLRPFVDPATLPVTWTFAVGAGSTLTALERTVSDPDSGIQVYNRAVVLAVGPDRYPIRAEAVVTNPLDPLYWTPDNDRPRPPYISADISTQAAANAVAQRLLIEGATYNEALASSAVPVPLIADRQVVHFTGAGVDDDYYLDTVTIPLGHGTMTMTTRKTRSLV